MKNLTYEVFDENIFIYKNLLTNPKELVLLLKESEKKPESSFLFKNWNKWSVFGTYMDAETPTDEQEKLFFNNKKFLLEKKI